MFRFTTGKFDNLENGFNFWRLSDKNSFGFKFVWGNVEDGRHLITARYSKVGKKFFFSKFQTSSLDDRNDFFGTLKK